MAAQTAQRAFGARSVGFFLTIEEAERRLAAARAAEEALRAEMRVGGRNVTAEALATANANIDFAEAQVEAAREHDAAVNDPARLKAISKVFDAHDKAVDELGARMVKSYDAAMLAMQDLVAASSALSRHCQATVRELHPLRPFNDDHEWRAKNADQLSNVARLLADDAATAEKALCAQRQGSHSSPPRISLLRRALDGDGLAARPEQRVAVHVRGAGGKRREVMKKASEARRMVDAGRARYVDPALDAVGFDGGDVA
jgi:hypothetical protein